jgi:hypothetical protein
MPAAFRPHEYNHPGPAGQGLGGKIFNPAISFLRLGLLPGCGIGLLPGFGIGLLPGWKKRL